MAARHRHDTDVSRTSCHFLDSPGWLCSECLATKIVQNSIWCPYSSQKNVLENYRIAILCKRVFFKVYLMQIQVCEFTVNANLSL